jgi:hypothetical protein
MMARKLIANGAPELASHCQGDQLAQEHDAADRQEGQTGEAFGALSK